MGSSSCKLYGRDQITHISHKTKVSSIIKILKNKFIYSPHDAHINKIKLEGTMVIDEYGSLDEEFKPSSTNSFPGIYLSVHTVYNPISKLYNTKQSKFVDKKGNIIKSSNTEVRLILSKKILNNDNWHFNIIDTNGQITTETLVNKTLYLYPPQDEIEEFYKNKFGSYDGNELVVHDSLSIDYINEIQTYSIEHYNEVKKIMISEGLDQYINLLRCNEDRGINEEENRKLKNILNKKRNHIYEYNKPYLMYKMFNPTMSKVSFLSYKYKNKESIDNDDLLNIYGVYLDYCGLKQKNNDTIESISNRIKEGGYIDKLFFERYKQNFTVYPPFLDVIK
jgi:hypothetical protein